jgi:hypothetical protein
MIQPCPVVILAVVKSRLLLVVTTDVVAQEFFTELEIA